MSKSAAVSVLENYLAKAAPKPPKGGWMIGSTDSSKGVPHPTNPVYRNIASAGSDASKVSKISQKHFAHFTAKDHEQAWSMHKRRSAERSLAPELRQAHKVAANFHAVAWGNPGSSAKVAKSMAKSSGEGSRGGRVIGHLKNGKPVYDSASHSGHANFTAQDHHEAAQVHYLTGQEHNFQAEQAQMAGMSKVAEKYRAMSKQHMVASKIHADHTKRLDPKIDTSLDTAHVMERPDSKRRSKKSLAKSGGEGSRGLEKAAFTPHGVSPLMTYEHGERTSYAHQLSERAAQSPSIATHGHAYAMHNTMAHEYAKMGPGMASVREAHVNAANTHAAAINKMQSGAPKIPMAKSSLGKSMAKSSGEGSRGGHVIGHTKGSNRPIYAASHESYTADNGGKGSVVGLSKHGSRSAVGAVIKQHKNYDEHDHMEAFHAHKGEEARLREEVRNAPGTGSMTMWHPSQVSAQNHRNKLIAEADAHGHVADAHLGASIRLETKRRLKEQSAQKSMAKSGGEGSRGGRIIGHTKSGNKPIYGAVSDRAKYANYSPEDHREVAQYHDAKIEQGQAAYGTTHRSNRAREVAHRFVLGHIQAKYWHEKQAAEKASAKKSMAKSGSVAAASGNVLTKSNIIVGKTSSGAKVRHPSHSDYAVGGTAPKDRFKGFTKQDHLEAASMHAKSPYKGSHNAMMVHKVYASGHIAKSSSGEGFGDSAVDTDHVAVDALGGSAALFMQQADLAQFPTMWAPIASATKPVN